MNVDTYDLNNSYIHPVTQVNHNSKTISVKPGFSITFKRWMDFQERLPKLGEVFCVAVSDNSYVGGIHAPTQLHEAIAQAENPSLKLVLQAMNLSLENG